MTNGETHPDIGALELVLPYDPILNKVARAVILNEIGTARIERIIDGMLEIAHGEQGNPDKPTMVGLAAPQVGVSERIIVVGIDAQGMGEEPTFRVYLNPEIIKRSDELAHNREGCYSTGEICGVLDVRHKEVTIKALNRDGEQVIEEHTDFAAIILQHEIDHLNGIRFPDRIADDNNLLLVKPEDFGEFRLNWDNWPNKASRSMWEAMKSGNQDMH